MRLAIIADTHMAAGGRRRLPDRCEELIAGSDLRRARGRRDDASRRWPRSRRSGLRYERWRATWTAGTCERGYPRRTRSTWRARSWPWCTMPAGGGPAGADAAPLPRADAVVFGHSHIPLHEREGDFQIFNPGSPTERRRAPSHSMGIARAEDGPHRVRARDAVNAGPGPSAGGARGGGCRAAGSPAPRAAVRAARSGPTNTYCAPTSTNRSTRSCASRRSICAGLTGARSRRSRRG